MRHLEVQSLKYLYADLYCQLTTKWLSSKQQLITGVSKDDVNVDYFGQIPGTKRIDFRVEWERSVFEAADVNSSNILKMLRGISKGKLTALRNSKRP